MELRFAPCPKCGQTNWSEPQIHQFKVGQSVLGAVFFGFIGLLAGPIGLVIGVAFGILCGYNFGKKDIKRTCLSCGRQYNFETKPQVNAPPVRRSSSPAPDVKQRIKQQLTDEYEFNVAGVTFGSRQKKLRAVADYALKFESDHDVDGMVHFILKREPENEHDPNAIAVLVEIEYSKIKVNGDLGQTKYKNIGMVGYVPAADAQEIAPKMDAGYFALVVSSKLKEIYSDKVDDDIISVHLDVKVEPSQEVIEKVDGPYTPGSKYD